MMKNYNNFINTIITILSCYLLTNKCFCEELESGLNDSIGGTIQLLVGINKILSAKKQITDPLSLTTIIANEIMNQANVSRIAPDLEELYKNISHPSNLTAEDSENNNHIPFNYGDILQNTENSYQYKTDQNIVEESTNYATTADPITEGIPTLLPTPKVIEETMILRNYDVQNEKNLFANNSTLEKFLSVQEDICYKIKYGIESIKNSQLVILFTKFLEYEYLKTKESWERIKITSSKIWESAINDEPQSSKSPNTEGIKNFLKILDQTKNQIQQSFFILKKPFSRIMRGVKNKFFNKTKKEGNDKDFCEKFYEAERKMMAAIKDFEKKFNKKLDLGIKNENKLLEEAKKQSRHDVIF